MTNPIGGMQPPHIPTLIYAVVAFLAVIVIYHLIHRH